jgi:hypothetical protein
MLMIEFFLRCRTSPLSRYHCPAFRLQRSVDFTYWYCLEHQSKFLKFETSFVVCLLPLSIDRPGLTGLRTSRRTAGHGTTSSQIAHCLLSEQVCL